LEFENADKSTIKIEFNDSNTFPGFTSSLILKGCEGEHLGIAACGPAVVLLGLLLSCVGDLGWVCGVHYQTIGPLFGLPSKQQSFILLLSKCINIILMTVTQGMSIFKWTFKNLRVLYL